MDGVGGRLPAFDGIAFIDFLRFIGDFPGLEGLFQLLNFLAVFIIFARHNRIDIRLIRAFHKQAIAGGG